MTADAVLTAAASLLAVNTMTVAVLELVRYSGHSKHIATA